MKALVTGAAGFAGGHLIEALAERFGGPVDGTYRPGLEQFPPSVAKVVRPHTLDLLDLAQCRAVLEAVQPTHLFHLAGPAHVGDSFKHADEVVRSIAIGTWQLFEAAAELPTPPRVVYVSSAEVYGDSALTADPLTETTPAIPNSPYAAAKLAAESYAAYFTRHGHLPVVIARPFNHIGPRQSPAFVASSFAKQIAEAEARGGEGATLKVGNLEAERDYTDVRDSVRGYLALAEHGRPGELYNLASGACLKTETLLGRLLALSPAKIDVVPDPERMRPADVPRRRGDATKANALGWRPTYGLDQTLKDLLQSWRDATRP